MKIFKSKIKGLVFRYKKWDYRVKDFDMVNKQVVWKMYYFLSIPIWRKNLLVEFVPEWAMIQRASLGSTDWKSSRPDLIDLIEK